MPPSFCGGTRSHCCVCVLVIAFDGNNNFTRERESLAFENPCHLTSIFYMDNSRLVVVVVILSAAVALAPPFCWVVFSCISFLLSLSYSFFFFCSDNYSNECMRRDGGKLNWQSLEKSAHTAILFFFLFFFFLVCAFVIYGVISCWATNVTDQILFCSSISSTATKEFRNFFLFFLFFLLGWIFWGLIFGSLASPVTLFDAYLYNAKVPLLCCVYFSFFFVLFCPDYAIDSSRIPHSYSCMSFCVAAQRHALICIDYIRNEKAKQQQQRLLGACFFFFFFPS